jgi:hypothetical protein
VGARVDHDVGVGETALRRGHAPQQCAQAGEQLVEGEGLRDVVVRAGVEPRHAVRDLALRSEHQDRDRVVGRARRTPADLEPVRRRHHHVEYSRVGFVALDREQRLVAVSRERDVVSLGVSARPSASRTASSSSAIRIRIAVILATAPRKRESRRSRRLSLRIHPQGVRGRIECRA